MPKEEIIEATPSLLKFREKRKWQLALRRYIIHKNINSEYAYYFGLGIEEIRQWIEIQFTEEMNWDNFGTSWQFDHIVPVTYFDFSNEEDLLLCWNFTNLRAEKIYLNKNRGHRVDVIAAKAYFQDLFNKTGYTYCQRLLEKIHTIELSNIETNDSIENFIIQKKEYLELIASLTKEEFTKINLGVSIPDIILEREIIRKFGS